MTSRLAQQVREPYDRVEAPREDARYGEGVLQRPLRGEAEVRDHAAVLERAAGEAEAVLKFRHDRVQAEVTVEKLREIYPKTYDAWSRVMEVESEGHAVPLKERSKERKR